MSNDFETWMYEQLLVPNIEDGIGKLRHTMPQLSDFDSFMKDLADNKISMTTKPLTSTSLTPTQRNFNEEKVDSLVKSGTWDTKPIITSKDKYVIDGHHRWLAAVKLGKKIPSRVVDMTCEDLLDFLKNKSYVETKTLRE